MEMQVSYRFLLQCASRRSRGIKAVAVSDKHEVLRLFCGFSESHAHGIDTRVLLYDREENRYW